MWSQPGHVVVSDDILVGNVDLVFGEWNVWQSVAEVKDVVAKLYSTNKHMCNINHPSPIHPIHPIIVHASALGLRLRRPAP